MEGKTARGQDPESTKTALENKKTSEYSAGEMSIQKDGEIELKSKPMLHGAMKEVVNSLMWGWQEIRNNLSIANRTLHQENQRHCEI